MTCLSTFDNESINTYVVVIYRLLVNICQLGCLIQLPQYTLEGAVMFVSPLLDGVKEWLAERDNPRAQIVALISRSNGFGGGVSYS